MASYISVPRDLSKVKTKVFMNLTKRQILCFGAGALIGVPVFFLLKSSGNLSLAALGMMAVMLPLFFLAMYEKDGQPLEVVAKHFYEAEFKRPKIEQPQTLSRDKKDWIIVPDCHEALVSKESFEAAQEAILKCGAFMSLAYLNQTCIWRG